jgi:hypothetical protein
MVDASRSTRTDQLNLVAHDIQLPRQEDRVECGVFVTCYHQVVLYLSQEERWRDLDRTTRLQQLSVALEQVIPMVAAQKRRHIRETLHGQRLAVRVEAQLGSHLVDLSKGQEEKTSLQQTSRRKRKGVERVAPTASSDSLDPPVKIPKTESQEGELRQGRRIYEIVGSPREGYNLKLKEKILPE